MSRGVFNNFSYTSIKELKDQYEGFDDINRDRRAILNDLRFFYELLVERHVKKIPNFLESLGKVCDKQGFRKLAVYEMLNIFHLNRLSDRTASKMNSSDINLILSAAAIYDSSSFIKHLFLFLNWNQPSIMDKKSFIINEIEEKIKTLERCEIDYIFSTCRMMTNVEFEMCTYDNDIYPF